MGAGRLLYFHPMKIVISTGDLIHVIWQYFLSIPTEGEERKSTKQKDKSEALKVARDES